MGRRIIFLDVDGVLNSRNTKETVGIYRFIERQYVARLATIVNITNAEIVLSSDWRFASLNDKITDSRKSFDGLVLRLSEYNLTISDMTVMDYDERRERWQEIELWLSEHPEVTQYAILDDIKQMGPLEGHHVWTSEGFGLQDKEMWEAVNLLWDYENIEDEL